MITRPIGESVTMIYQTYRRAMITRPIGESGPIQHGIQNSDSFYPIGCNT